MSRSLNSLLTGLCLVILILDWPCIAAAQTVVAQSGQTIATGGTGQQILFPDKTSISVGANSQVAVTRADYDSRTGTSNVVIGILKGAVRYVTGDTRGSHTLRTPLSTVGVRGTVIEGYVDQNGNEIFALIEGAFEVCTRLACQQVTSPGTFVIVSRDGAISLPAPVPPSMMSALLLATPSLDLVLEQVSDRINNGHDPLVTFRSLNDQRINAPLPVPPPLPGSGAGSLPGSSSGGAPECRRGSDCGNDMDDGMRRHR